MADANSSCEISERGKRRHRIKQNAKGWKKQMPNCLQRLQPRRNLDQQITTVTRQISRDVEIWSRNLKRVQIILGQITRCNMVSASMRTSRAEEGDRDHKCRGGGAAGRSSGERAGLTFPDFSRTSVYYGGGQPVDALFASIRSRRRVRERT